MLPGGGCYKVSLAYFLLLYYYPGRVVAEAMCRADGCGGYVSGGRPCYMKIRLTQPNFVELGLRLSLAKRRRNSDQEDQEFLKIEKIKKRLKVNPQNLQNNSEKKRKPRRTIADVLINVLSNGDVRHLGNKHVSWSNYYF